jgi:hypothetical protein
VVASEARPSKAEAKGLYAPPTGYGRPSGESLLGVVVGMKVKVGRVTAEIDPKLLATVKQMYDLSFRKITDQLEAIGDEVGTAASVNWYDEVQRKTGQTGRIEWGLQAAPDRLSMVVSPTATKDTYYVHRPGPNSTLSVGTDEFTYRRLMSIYRKTGTIEKKYLEYVKYTTKGQPIGLSYRIPNPKASDGKYMWKRWVLDHGKHLATRLKDRGSEELDAYVGRKLRRVG